MSPSDIFPVPLGLILKASAFALVPMLLFSFVTGGPAVGPAHELDSVVVDNAGRGPVSVTVRVSRGGTLGNATVLTTQTVRVSAADYPTPPEGSGSTTGMMMSGQTSVTKSWQGTGRYVVRARLTGAEEWHRLDLGAVDRRDDERGWFEPSQRWEEIECYAVSVRVGMDGSVTNLSHRPSCATV